MYLPILHTSSNGSLWSAWAVEPFVSIPLLLTAIAYGTALRKAHSRGRRIPGHWRIAAFYGGLAAIWIALAGPPGVWNDELFFLHMLQHLLIILVAPPLILAGRPAQLTLQAVSPARTGQVLRPILRRGWLRRALEIITHPVSVAVVFNANLVIWHLPGMYGLALEDDLVHELEHLAFLGTAMLFWWTIIDPIPRNHRISDHWLLGLSFTTCMIGNLVAAALTLSPRVIYTYYEQAANPWGLSPLTDQQIGGVIMWISGAVYFAIMFITLYRVVQPAPQTGTNDRAATA